jgi:hypothetical protein
MRSKAGEERQALQNKLSVALRRLVYVVKADISSGQSVAGVIHTCDLGRSRRRWIVEAAQVAVNDAG